MKLLIEYGSDINFTKSVTRMTPLHWAAYNDDRETVALLLDKNAIIKFNTQGSSPIDMAGLAQSY